MDIRRHASPPPAGPGRPEPIISASALGKAILISALIHAVVILGTSGRFFTLARKYHTLEWRSAARRERAEQERRKAEASPPAVAAPRIPATGPAAPRAPAKEETPRDAPKTPAAKTATPRKTAPAGPKAAEVSKEHPKEMGTGSIDDFLKK